MQKVTLNILAQDIQETDYSEAHDCAITRALNRAGFVGYIDRGLDIVDDKNRVVIEQAWRADENTANQNSYSLLGKRVIGMYGYLNKVYLSAKYTAQEPKDFSVELEFNTFDK